MSGWIMSIVGAICLSTLIDVIMDDGETKKFIKGISSLIIFAVIISPLPKLINEDYDITAGITQTEEASLNTDEYSDFLYNVKHKEYSSIAVRCEEALAEEGISGVTLSPELSYGEKIELIGIIAYLKNAVISEELGNININEVVIQKVSSFFGADRAIISVVG